MASAEREAGLERSVTFAVDYLVEGLVDFGVGRTLGGAMVHAIADERLGPAFLDRLLEPTLQAVEARLSHHLERGELRECDPRAAALFLVSPILLAGLHQQELGGRTCRPLDLRDLARAQREAFMRAFAPAI